jgi:hypothetical protein
MNTAAPAVGVLGPVPLMAEKTVTENPKTATGGAATRGGDVFRVGSRVRWGAILAGAVLGLALYLLLTLLGAAVGLSVSDKVRPGALGAAAAGWAIVTTALCLFLGGYLASQFSVGENRFEGAVYGLLVWAVVFAMLLWLMASGVRTGFNAMVGMAGAGEAAETTAAEDWEAAARRYGVPQPQIDDWKQKAKGAPAAAARAIEDPQHRQAAADAAARVTWYAFLGTLVSMLAASAGGYLGVGRQFWVVVRPARPTTDPRHGYAAAV